MKLHIGILKLKMLATASACLYGRVIHADPLHGSDANVGGHESPVQTLCACVGVLKQAGDECRLHTGTYEVGQQTCTISDLLGTAAQPIVIAAAGDGPVIIDGTIAVGGPWTKTVQGLFASSVTSSPITHLFVDGEMQVLARYPNARWSDKTVFMANEYWSVPSSFVFHVLTFFTSLTFV